MCVCVCVCVCVWANSRLVLPLFRLSTQFSYCCVASRLFVICLGFQILGSTIIIIIIIIRINNNNNNNNNNLAKYGALTAFLMKLPHRDDRSVVVDVLRSVMRAC